MIVSGDLIVGKVPLKVIKYDNSVTAIIDYDLIELTDADGIISEMKYGSPISGSFDFSVPVPNDASMLYLGKSSVCYVGVSYPETPVHFVFYDGVVCVIVCHDDWLEQSFNVVSHS